MKVTLFIICFFVFSISQSHGQFNQKKQQYADIKLSDGSHKKGQVKKMDDDNIILILPDQSEISISRNDITEIKFSTNPRIAPNIKEQLPASYEDNYYFLPSALPTGKGVAYYRNYEIFWNQFTYGVSENFSITGGFETLSLFVASRTPGFFIAPKISLGKDNFHLGIGTTAFFVEEDGVGGLLYTNTTLGTVRQNITFGVSLLYADSGFFDKPVLNVDGIFPISKKVSFIGELITGVDIDGAVYNIGLRVLTNSRIAFDMALIRVTGNVGSIPLLGISIPLGDPNSN